jgi:hypothetical protein
MKCFNHGTVDAVGVCKHCYKALCRDCAVEVAGSISCRGPCEQEVVLVNALTRRAGTSYGKTSKAYLRATVIYILLGVLFGVFAIYQQGTFIRAFLIIMAVVFLLGGGLYFRSSREFRQE